MPGGVAKRALGDYQSSRSEVDLWGQLPRDGYEPTRVLLAGAPVGNLDTATGGEIVAAPAGLHRSVRRRRDDKVRSGGGFDPMHLETRG